MKLSDIYEIFVLALEVLIVMVIVGIAMTIRYIKERRKYRCG
jgi:hypothetical protein